jgi:hypothetical protein
MPGFAGGAAAMSRASRSRRRPSTTYSSDSGSSQGSSDGILKVMRDKASSATARARLGVDAAKQRIDAVRHRRTDRYDEELSSESDTEL